MAFTRFHDDPCRKIKALQQSTGPGRYILDVPGNGSTPAFMNDPHIISQKWGGNLWTNTVNLESALLGINGKANRDALGKDEYSNRNVQSAPAYYPVSGGLTTEQPRATMPAWTVRDKEQTDYYYLPLNPQENTCFPFENNLSTRILEKDHFVKDHNAFINKTFTPLIPFAIQKNLSSSNSGISSSTQDCEKVK